MKFYLNGKRITQKELVALVGKKRVQEFKTEAMKTHAEDSLVELSWFLGAKGTLIVEMH